MEKKFAYVLTLVALLSLAGCGGKGESNSSGNSTSSSGSISLPVTLDAPQNLQFVNGVISFDEVSGAEAYEIEITKEDAIVFNSTIDTTSYDTDGLGLEGSNTLSVVAVSNNGRSEAATLEIEVLIPEQDVILEAENGLIGFGDKNNSTFRNNDLAHGGAYAGGIDNCGQGVHFEYYSYIAGVHDFEVYYTTGVIGSYHNIYVNGENQATAVYEENTGWGGIGSYNAAEVTVSISLNVGWNTIDIIKDGTSSDNPSYGGWAELDYFVIKGTGEEYNPDDFIMGNPVYKLEGELGTQIKWNGDAWTTSNPAAYSENASNHYIQGNIDAVGDGIEWHFSAPKTGTYRVELAYAHANTEGETFATFTTSEDRTPIVMNLPVTNLGWGNPVVNSSTVDITLNAGDNFIYCKKGEGSQSFQVDYITLSLIEME